MSKQFNLIIQCPKSKNLGLGVFSLGKDGDAQFFSGQGESGSTVLASLTRARVDYSAGHGIMVSGMEKSGNGYRYQEWWLRFLDCEIEG